ncbi:hypothetical protein MVEG_07446 [Podila verticillata NRRL 6337]|nr:hypothetical protein MVEG_07446 [Podila verticillata NRRL 6337]
MATPSTDVSCASTSSQESSRNANVLSSFGVGGRSSRQSYLPYSLRSDLNNNNNNNGIFSEQTRIAAVAAIANTLQQRDGRSFRGDSPYIPSSLSMLFSDPEVMQQELGREQLQDPQEQQPSVPRRYSRSRGPFRSRDHGQEDSDSSCVDGSDSEEEYEDGEDEDEAQKLFRAKKGKGYGYEVVQDEPIFSYAAMIREEYIAPHEPSSSSPLFPSPLTTLGRFAPGAILVPTDDQSQTGRIWQGYGTMDNYQSNNEPPPATPLHQSHAAYYHAVSNYMYPSYDENTLGNSEDGGSRSGSYGINQCVPTQYAIPGHDRRASQGSANNGRRHERPSDDDNWLWGIVVSVSACWLCFESPVACCSGCCCCL